jgi:hypothetical protein
MLETYEEAGFATPPGRQLRCRYRRRIGRVRVSVCLAFDTSDVGQQGTAVGHSPYHVATRFKQFCERLPYQAVAVGQ